MHKPVLFLALIWISFHSSTIFVKSYKITGNQLLKGVLLCPICLAIKTKCGSDSGKRILLDLRERVVGWRKQNAITRIDKPSRLQRARRLGYKAKQGIVVVRMRVGTGGMRKQRPTGGRRPKHLGVTRIKADDNMKTVADRRVLERYPNMQLLGSYFVYKDGKPLLV